MLNSLRKKRVVTWVIAFLLGSAASGLTIGALSQEAPQDQTTFGIGFDPTDPSEDLLQPGRRVTLAVADSTVPFSLIRPQHASASDASVIEVWLGEAGVNEVGFRYASGLRAYLTVWPEGKDPASFYKSHASDSGAGRYQEINGYPAWVVSADEQAKGYPPTSVVDLSIGNVEISLHADLPADTLVEVAATVS
jgi:hypothetical protein